LKAPAQSLNEDEQRLVEKLNGLCKERKLSEENVYLLRNPRNRGVGFEQGGYPDFLLWIKDGKHEKLIFLDPHGLVFEPDEIENVDKVKLTKRINKLESQLDDSNIEMHSYVISTTNEKTLKDKSNNFSKEDYENNNVYLQDEGYLEKILRDANINIR